MARNSNRTLTVAGVLAHLSGDQRRDAEILLAVCLRSSRSSVIARPDAELGAAVAQTFDGLLRRRCRGEPIAYLTGEKEFWSLALKVTADVLVPRPDTETLVEAALAAGPSEKPLTVLDLGTGSGAIALALAWERRQWRVTASDVSEAAIAIARGNAERLDLGGVEFLAGDWYCAVGDRRFDLIVANPPYIAAGDPLVATPELSFEPRAALVAGATGLEALEIIVAGAPPHLATRGMLLVEHGFDQAAAVRKMLNRAGFSNIRTLRDLAGHERVSFGTVAQPVKSKESIPP